MRYSVITFFIFLSCSDVSVDKNLPVKINSSTETISSAQLDNLVLDSLKTDSTPKYERITDRNALEYLTNFSSTNKDYQVRIITPYGSMDFLLYKDTPLHRASFIHLIKEKYFSNVEITRIKKNHVVQGGNSQEESKAMQRFMLGEYHVPAEFKSHHAHKKGALALARSMNNNPNKESSPYDFYIVHGRKSGSAELYNIEREKRITYSDNQKEVYKKLGGTPHLDQEFTVFGEIISGMTVLNKLANLEVDGQDWPKDDLLISIEIIE